MLVSSKHLSLASSVFHVMFENNFREGLELQSSDKAEVLLPEHDLEAFTLLMNIIHAKSRQIPRKVTLSLLLKLAILVDKYQLLEAISAWGDIWVAALKQFIPHRFCNDLISWLCITWVFRCPDEFQAVTLFLERESPEPNLSTSYGKEEFEKLPVPDTVLARIKRNRHAAIECLFRALNKIVQNLTKPWPVYCEKADTQCEGMILGTLLRSASQLEIWPIPDSPYHNMSYSLVAHKMRSLTATSYCFRSTRFKMGCNSVDVDRAGILDNLERLLLSVESLQLGLSLEDYPREEGRGDGD
ncbi:hypothetical protein BGZ60DRAFT_477629 [Tricladium varicosporioides]|nr:hypothetical protein BGZ60DRAFT_477629 [Hymenoscyphus varicosporioides]